jgi:hypothetical protein
MFEFRAEQYNCQLNQQESINLLYYKQKQIKQNEYFFSNSHDQVFFSLSFYTILKRLRIIKKMVSQIYPSKIFHNPYESISIKQDQQIIIHLTDD